MRDHRKGLQMTPCSFIRLTIKHNGTVHFSYNPSFLLLGLEGKYAGEQQVYNGYDLFEMDRRFVFKAW